MGRKKPIRLGVSGACGKMGLRILSLAAQDKDFRIVLGLECLGHPQTGEEMFGVKVAHDRALIDGADCLIDFSSPDATLENLSVAARFKKAVVIGTTGFSDEQKKAVGDLAKKIPVVFSPNMSVGVNVLFELVRQAARSLPEEYDARIVEAHHVHKKDSPSGTAKFIAGIVKQERRVECADIRSIRQGEIIGDHDVIFESPVDTIVLRHSAKTRDIFAQGALHAAKFVVKKKKGLFGMADVLKELKK